jgi:DNA-directed RNA polymerase beta subunit
MSPFLPGTSFGRLRKQLLRTLIQTYDLAGEHIRSFDEFLNDGIGEIIRTLSPAVAYSNGHIVSLQFANPLLSTPRIEDSRLPPRALLPDECKVRTIGYCGVLYVDVHIKTFLQTPDQQGSFKKRVIPVQEDGFSEEACRLRYWSELDVQEQKRECVGRLVRYTIHRRVRIVRLPIMLLSQGCNLTHGLGKLADFRNEVGGTFLVRGAPKIIPALAGTAWNSIFVFQTTKCLAMAEIRCVPYARRLYSTTNVVLRLATPNLKSATFGIGISVALPFMSKPLPLAVVLRALGWSLTSFKRAVLSIRYGKDIPELDFKLEALFAVLPDGCSEQDARLRLANSGNRGKTVLTLEKLEANARYILERNLFPNIETFEAKGLLLARAVVRLFATTCVPPLQQFDERDHLAAKRFETVGWLCTTLLRQVLNNSMDILGKVMEKLLNKNKIHSPADLLVLIDVNAVSKRLAFALSTGQWSASRACQPVSRKNVCQPLQTQSFLAVVSHFSKVSASVNHEAKQSSLRQVQLSGYGFIDPQESPDGKTCGLVNHFAFQVRLSCAADPSAVMRALAPFLPNVGFIPVQEWVRMETQEVFDTLYPLCVEDSHIGWVSDSNGTMACVRALRRMLHISPEVSVHLEHNEIRILCCGGRPLRPLLVTDDSSAAAWEELMQETEASGQGQLMLQVSQLETCGLLEYVDAAECKNLVIALSPEDRQKRLARFPDLKFTHMEIDASLMFGISSALIPFPEHNQVTRNSFESSMAKQGIDAYFPTMPQATKHTIDYPQSMLVETEMTRVAAGLTDLRGQNGKFVMFPAGMNCEDAAGVSQAAVDRGFMTSTRYKCDRDQQNSQGSGVNAETFERPDPIKTLGMQHSPVAHLMLNGLPKLGTVLQTGDIIIGKTTAVRPGPSRQAAEANKTKRDVSTIHQGTKAVVYRTLRASTLNGDQVSKVFTKQVRPIERGDKFDSRHAQKVTVGLCLKPEDMIYSLIDGTSPDFIVHSVSFVGRKTLGQIREGLCSKVLALRPTNAKKLGLNDGTAFARSDKAGDERAIGYLLRHPWPEQLEHVLGPRPDAAADPCEAQEKVLTFPECGREPYMCGKTGRVIQGLVFTGLASFQKLLHFAADKIYAAFTAQKTLLLRYRGGRADLGGLKVGSMEVDVLAAYGVSFIMQESLVKLADPCFLYFCRHCGLMCLVVADCKSYCSACNVRDVAVKVETVHLLKQLLYEIAHMNVLVKFDLETISEFL